MTILEFNNKEEYIYSLTETPEDKFFKTSKGQQMLDSMVYGIETAIIENKRNAILFELSFTDSGTGMKTGSSKSNWQKVLEKCLFFYERVGEVDKAIDTYNVIKKLNIHI